MPADTRRVTGFDPRRGVQSEVLVQGGVADWDALPRVPLRLRTRPWASVRLGEAELGQTHAAAGAGRAGARFEQVGRVVNRVVDVRAGVDAVKVNVDMADPDCHRPVLRHFNRGPGSCTAPPCWA